MDTDRLIEVAPHYLAMLLLAFLVLTVIRSVADGIGFWVEFAVVMVTVFAYRPIVMRLGIGPGAWE